MKRKTRRNISRIIPFGFIWAFFFGSQIVNDLSSQRNTAPVSEGDIALTTDVAIFAFFASFFSGLLIGAIEVLVFEGRFRKYSFFSTISIKLGIYLIVFLVIIVTLHPIAYSIESQQSMFSQDVLKATGVFLGTVPFWNTLAQLGFGLFLCVSYSAVSENIGYNQLRNLILGSYHKPVEENRIFMFLDMKDSTNIAEILGHERYFQLLSDYYDSMSDAIIQHKGEVYQYIGDEVVVTWKASEGLENANCIRSFFAIDNALSERSEYFKKTFGIVPGFKAGFHIGEVTTGELGALKREIVFTGDVLNTAARLQGMCKIYEKDCLVSGDLKNQLHKSEDLQIKKEGEEVLRGKEGSTEIFSVERL